MGDMRPLEGDTTVFLPITFDYNGGRADNVVSKYMWTIFVSIGWVLFSGVILFNGNVAFLSKLLVIVISFVVCLFFLRFVVHREITYSNAYEKLAEVDFQPSSDTFWGIYDVEKSYPYIAHFKNGTKGLYIALEKDVIVGKSTEAEYSHYEEIANAYRMAWSTNIDMVAIDYMDNVGKDDRINGLYDSLNDCDNPDIKDMLLQVYANLQSELSRKYASFDVYLFVSRGDSDTFWYDVQDIVDQLLRANYLTFRVLDIYGIRDIAMALYNLNDFSAVHACKQVYQEDYKNVGITPISIERSDGSVEKLNKTSEEKRLELIEQEKELKRKKASKRNSSTKGKSASTRVKKTSSSSTSVVDSHNSVNTEPISVTPKIVSDDADDSLDFIFGDDELNIF